MVPTSKVKDNITYDEILEKLKRYIDNEEQLQACKLQGLLLVAEPGERDALKGIECHDGSHDAYVLGMVSIAHEGGHTIQSTQHKQEEEQRGGEDGYEDCAIHPCGLQALLVGKAEESRLHAVGEQHHHQCRKGIDVGDDSISARSGTQLGGVEGHEQVVEETAHNAAQAVDGRLFGQ